MPTPSSPLRQAIEDLKGAPDEWGDLTPVIANAVADGMEEGLTRAKMATKPDSDASGLSVSHGETHIRAKGWMAVLGVSLGIAIAAAVVGAFWLGTR